MNKAEALAVLHEIYETCRDSVSLTVVSLDAKHVGSAQTAGYQIRMKCDLDTLSRRCIMSILEKHKLAIKEERDYVVIFKVAAKLSEFLENRENWEA